MVLEQRLGTQHGYLMLFISGVWQQFKFISHEKEKIPNQMVPMVYRLWIRDKHHHHHHHHLSALPFQAFSWIPEPCWPCFARAVIDSVYAASTVEWCPSLSLCAKNIYPGWWWLEPWNFMFPYIGNVIIPTDELIFFRGVGWNHQPVYDWVFFFD